MEESRRDLETDKVTEIGWHLMATAINLIGCGLILIEVAVNNNLAKLLCGDLLLSVRVKQGEGLLQAVQVLGGDLSVQTLHTGSGFCAHS